MIFPSTSGWLATLPIVARTSLNFGQRIAPKKDYYFIDIFSALFTPF